MSERREQFDDTVEKAVRDREHAQTHLAISLASEIQADLASFDPTRLQTLGPEGIRALLRELELDPAVGNGGAQQTAPPSPYDSAIKSWADMRRAEPNTWLEAVLLGSGIGLLVVFATSLATRFLF